METTIGVVFVLHLLVSLHFPRESHQRIESCSTCCRGPSGKGTKGDNGDIGPRGEKGDNGPPGEKGDRGTKHNNNVTAFSAVRDADFNILTNGEALPFDVVQTNVGDDFDGPSGVFTCVIPGIYWLAYTIGSPIDTYLYVNLMKNNERVSEVYIPSFGSGSWAKEANNAVVLELVAGDQMWIKCMQSGRLIAGSYRTSFTGFLINEM